MFEQRGSDIDSITDEIRSLDRFVPIVPIYFSVLRVAQEKHRQGDRACVNGDSSGAVAHRLPMNNNGIAPVLSKLRHFGIS